MIRLSGFVMFLSALMLVSCSTAQNTPATSTGSSGSSSSSGITLSPDGQATLIETNDVKILKLSGTNYQMGYNYGYLLAAEIVRLVGGIATWAAEARSSDYDDLISSQGIISWNANVLAEMNGMIAGIRDALPESQRNFTPYLSTNRQISVEDLQVANTLPDWACSSFSVWGAGRTDGSSLMARNLDYYSDPGGILATSHLIVSYSPAQGTKWVNITFCGMAGSISGMNEYGLCGAMHDTDDYTTTSASGFVPRSVALRRLLERLTNSTIPADGESFLDGQINFTGNNFHMLYSSAGRADTNIGFVLEYDGYAVHADGRCTLRTIADNPVLSTNAYFDQQLSFTNALITVNHYLKRRTAAPNSGNNSGTRYMIIKNSLSNAMLDGNVTVEEGRQIMSQVGISYYTGVTVYTLQTMVFEPNEKQFHVWFATTNASAYDGTEHMYQLSDLF